MTPDTQLGFGVGVILMGIGWLTTHLPLMAENRRLRRSLAVRDQHPAVRPQVGPAAMSPDAQEAWERHTAAGLALAAQASLRPVADVHPIHPQREAGDLS